MYLKKIEAQGFKSFANKTVLEFDPGIMGIVGPNGSGKSNIADAIRWVLGEQSAKQLRGSNMQDVIFSGTEHRKAMGFASVSLTIDNSDHMLGVDFPEVVVCRRVYRSGDSEYLLNGSPCRLRDISELFYDTGVGRDGYSIIGQGQVEKVLSGRPEDRRELFDEAAGIVKYKKRKLIAQKKLEDEQKNIVRITDILGELERQVGPLSRQSEKARQYLKLKNDLRKLEVGAFYMEASDIQRRLDDVSGRLEIVRGDLERSSERAEETRILYEKLEAENAELEARLEGRRQEAEELKVRREGLDGRMRLLEEQAAAAERDDMATAQRLAALRKSAETAEAELEAAKASGGEVGKNIEVREQALEKEQENAERIDSKIEAAERELSAENTRLMGAMDKKTAILAQIQKNIAELQMADSRKEEAGEQSASDEEEEKTLRSNRAAQEEKLNKLAEDIADREKAAEAAGRKLAGNREETAALYAALDEARKRFHTESSRLETLVNISERYEGYGQSVRRIMEQKASVPGICGVVANLLHVEKKYEAAIETALGGRLQNIVTDSAKTAQAMVDFLKKNKYGRATFMPLTEITVKGGFPQPAALKEEGALGIASELVSCDANYRVIAEFLLGRILVADTAAHALAIARKYSHSLSIVTLEGEHFAPGGTLTGGAYKSSSNLLGRRREIEELKKSIDKLQEEIEDHESRIIENSAKKAKLNDKLNSANDALQNLRVEEAAASEVLRQIDEKLEELAGNREQRTQAAEQLSEQIKVLKADREALDAAAGRLSEEQAAATEKQQELTGLLADLRLEKSDAERSAAALQAEVSALREKENFIRNELFRLAREKGRIAVEIDDVERSRSVRESAEVKRQQIEEAKAEAGEVSAQIEAAAAVIAEESAAREKLASRMKEVLSDRMSLAEDTSRLDKDAYRLEAQKERLDSQLEQQVEYLWTEYGLTPTEAEQEKRETDRSLRDIRRDISRRKEEIRELGPVNVNAIEEYKEVSERFEFLSAQHADLTKAEQELLGIIGELDTAMRAQFKEKFSRIQEEFNIVFTELFGGGKGSLELTQSESGDLLDAGITIIAQPPGKRLQNMMQLSGGEKALTAIALLFAIQNLKPSPFCLLDEIEAALDEPNVIRFADYLQKLKGRTQFIVITHRRGTMEVSERLYGVTMQEKGISTLVSVNLSDPELVS